MNYVYNNRGWRGPSPGWDTSKPVDQHGRYDLEALEADSGNMDQLMRRMETVTLDTLEGVDGIERPWNRRE